MHAARHETEKRARVLGTLVATLLSPLLVAVQPAAMDGAKSPTSTVITDVNVVLRRRPQFLRRPQCEELHILVAHAASAVTVVKLGLLPRKVLKNCVRLLPVEQQRQQLLDSECLVATEQHILYDKIDRCFAMMVDVVFHSEALHAFQVSARRSSSKNWDWEHTH